MDGVVILGMLSLLEDKKYLERYKKNGLSYKDLVGVDNELAMFLSLEIAKVLVYGNCASGNVEEHNKFCEKLTGEIDGRRTSK